MINAFTVMNAALSCFGRERSLLNMIECVNRTCFSMTRQHNPIPPRQDISGNGGVGKVMGSGAEGRGILSSSVIQSGPLFLISLSTLSESHSISLLQLHSITCSFFFSPPLSFFLCELEGANSDTLSHSSA